MTSTFPCPDCGQQVSKSARTCPHCGRAMQYGDHLTPEQKAKQRRGCWIVIGIVLAIILLSHLLRACVGGD